MIGTRDDPRRVGVILGLLTLLSRGKTVIIEERQERDEPRYERREPKF